jgi:hypothetical protein
MVSVPSWLPPFVQDRMATEAARGPQFARAVTEAGGMLLYGTIGHEAYLRSDGSVWFHRAVDWTNDPDTYEWHQADRIERWGAILIATKRYPELLELLPARSREAPDCKKCGGSGRLIVDVNCPECGGLGWVPEEAA